MVYTPMIGITRVHSSRVCPQNSNKEKYWISLPDNFVDSFFAVSQMWKISLIGYQWPRNTKKSFVWRPITPYIGKMTDFILPQNSCDKISETNQINKFLDLWLFIFLNIGLRCICPQFIVEQIIKSVQHFWQTKVKNSLAIFK